MSRVKLLAAVLTFALTLAAQTTTTAESYKVQVSYARSWSDTGLDLKSGDSLKISLASSQTPSGCTAAQSANLPLPSTPAGALLARLHSQGSAPIAITLDQPIRVEEASHLFLGFNNASAFGCSGISTFSIHVIPAGSAATTAEGQQTRGQQLKSQLGAAAQIFMSGQFGTGKPESATSNLPGAAGANASGLTISATPLDADLRKNIDSLPRRVNDQFKNLGDMVNFVIVGDQRDVQTALEAASWHVAEHR